MRRAGLGAKLQRARLDRGLKQKDVAAAVHVEPVTVSRWERGATTPDLGMLERLAELYGIPLSAFVSERATELDGALVERLDHLDATVAEMRELLRSLVEGQRPPAQDQPGDETAARDRPA
jgi:transcriptional regulator with XRE-family HTH domain